MSSVPIAEMPASNLTSSDLAMFERIGVPADLLTRARVERVSDLDARDRFGFNGRGDNSGIVFPYVDAMGILHTARLRRDHHEVENDRPIKKYVLPYGNRRHAYIVPGDHGLADDPNIPVIVVEAEKSALALRAWSDRIRFALLPIAVGGCWGWRARIGKVENSKGERVDEMGPLAELGVCSDGRKTYVLLDANCATKSSVKAARRALVRQLQKQKADVRIIDLPAVGDVNGPDDYLGRCGDEAMQQLLDSPPAAAEGDPARFSEDELALRFTAEHPDLRYTAIWGKWHSWNGVHWLEDDTLAIFDKVRGVCRSASSECDPDKERMTKLRLSAASTVAAVERLARSDREHAASTDQWDRDPWLLGTPGGTIDLTTGRLRPARQEDYLTRSTAVAPNSDPPKLWLLFLDRIMNGNAELISYLQRAAGYSLTGVTREHAMFFFYGSGGNGKTTFVSTITKILGSYATSAPISTFTASKTEQHPTDLAGLRGARLVTAVETEDGSRWAEVKIKALTGGDRIAARKMRQDFFEYTPVFKLLVAGNHRPGLRSVDEAIRRRLHLVPFDVTIPEAERDLQLVEKLESEFPSILSWAVEGCLAWQREGLNPPEAVRIATEHYLEGEDRIGRWLEDCCTTGKQYWSSSRCLYQSFKDWSDRSGEHAGSQKRFSQALETRGFVQERTHSAKGFRGLALSRDLEDELCPM